MVVTSTIDWEGNTYLGGSLQSKTLYVKEGTNNPGSVAKFVGAQSNGGLILKLVVLTETILV